MQRLTRLLEERVDAREGREAREKRDAAAGDGDETSGEVPSLVEGGRR